MVVWTFSESALLLKPMQDTFNKHINPRKIYGEKKKKKKPTKLRREQAQNYSVEPKH